VDLVNIERMLQSLVVKAS